MNRAGLVVVSLLAAVLLVACGGGGSSAGGEAPDDPSAFPVLVPSGSFQLPSIAAPPDLSAPSGTQRGIVRVGAGIAPPAGTLVELVDASNALQPRVIASTTTDGEGQFSIAAGTSGQAADHWLRVTLGAGVHMRAFATGWTEVTPATDAVVAELMRLRQAGAFDARPISADELARSQTSLTLLWLARHSGLAPTAASEAVVRDTRFDSNWNRWLASVAAGTSATGTGDIATLVPLSGARWQTSVRVNGNAATPAEFVSNCFANPGSDDFGCGTSSQAQPDLSSSYAVDRSGIRLRPESGGGDPLSAVFAQVGHLSLLEFPYVVGTRVLFDNPRLIPSLDTTLRASVRIVRRTYPPEPIQALGRMPHAVRVVLDYEIAIRSTVTNAQADLLVREERWFAPDAGIVVTRLEGLVRSATGVVTEMISVDADSVAGVVGLGPVVPHAGVADSVALAVRHLHAVHAKSLDRIYMSTPNNGGQVLELDAATLGTLRTIAVGATPRRLAVSADGTRLYAGLDGGAIAEWRLADLTLMRTTTPLSSPGAGLLDRFYDLAVDPFDAGRVLAYLGSSAVAPSGAVVTFKDGNLQYRDAPRYSASGWGWGYYFPTAIAWSSVPDEFFAPGQRGALQMNRFSARGAGFGELLTVESGDETGSIEVSGEIVGQLGSVFSAGTFAKLRQFTLAPFQLERCLRLGNTSTTCRLRNDAVAPPNLVLLDHANGDFLGVYQPAVTAVANGCAEASTREGSLGLDDVQVVAIGNSRLMASSLSTPLGDAFCSFHVWKLRGVSP